MTAWQSRPLEAVYAVVFFDALRVKIREDAVVRNKAIYLALGVRRDGSREILGLWIETTEGAKFWMKVFNDLRTRGVTDMLIAVTDGLKGMPEALSTAFPATTLQTCIAAATLVAELGDITRFANPRQLMAYLGLVPSEHSSGGTRRQGGITKAGNGAARRMLIEAAFSGEDQPRAVAAAGRSGQADPRYRVEGTGTTLPEVSQACTGR